MLIRRYTESDLEQMVAVWNEVVADGVAFPQEEALDAETGRRFFAEQSYCGRGAAAPERYAARWAAKEAVLKALGTGWSVGIAWTDVEVVKLPSGAVSVALAGGAARRAEELGVTEVLLTLSHGKNHAVAFAVAQGQ